MLYQVIPTDRIGGRRFEGEEFYKGKDARPFPVVSSTRTRILVKIGK